MTRTSQLRQHLNMCMLAYRMLLACASGSNTSDLISDLFLAAEPSGCFHIFAVSSHTLFMQQLHSAAIAGARQLLHGMYSADMPHSVPRCIARGCLPITVAVVAPPTVLGIAAGARVMLVQPDVGKCWNKGTKRRGEGFVFD